MSFISNPIYKETGSFISLIGGRGRFLGSRLSVQVNPHYELENLKEVPMPNVG